MHSEKSFYLIASPTYVYVRLRLIVINSRWETQQDKLRDNYNNQNGKVAKSLSSVLLSVASLKRLLFAVNRNECIQLNKMLCNCRDWKFFCIHLSTSQWKKKELRIVNNIPKLLEKPKKALKFVTWFHLSTYVYPNYLHLLLRASRLHFFIAFSTRRFVKQSRIE